MLFAPGPCVDGLRCGFNLSNFCFHCVNVKVLLKKILIELAQALNVIFWMIYQHLCFVFLLNYTILIFLVSLY
jgi:hypothetical protein